MLNSISHTYVEYTIHSIQVIASKLKFYRKNSNTKRQIPNAFASKFMQITLWLDEYGMLETRGS